MAALGKQCFKLKDMTAVCLARPLVTMNVIGNGALLVSDIRRSRKITIYMTTLRQSLRTRSHHGKTDISVDSNIHGNITEHNAQATKLMARR